MRRVALVTGSGKKRVGNAIAVALAKAGFDLAIHYRTSKSEAEDTVKELGDLGVEAKAFRADVGNESEVKAMVADVIAAFGRIDVLVNAAAVWQKKSLEDATADDVKLHFETNALGTFLLCQHVGLHMCTRSTGGAIVNIGDWAEVRPYLDYAAYFPSKGAVTALTRSFAVELASRNPNVRVNAILPGPVMLPSDLDEAERKQAIDGTLVKREGTPEHVAMAAMMLIENDFITGVCLPVDGGRTLQS